MYKALEREKEKYIGIKLEIKPGTFQLLPYCPGQVPMGTHSWVPNRLASSLCPCFVEASPMVEKAVLCYKADRLVALLLRSAAFGHRLQYACFVLQGKNSANEAMDGFVQT